MLLLRILVVLLVIETLDIGSVNMANLSRRALHFVLKVGSLKDNVKFFRDKLGMQVLRHEVFDQGCEATCNGPYDNKWSKTMIGYGAEDDHFVLELTYNYSVSSYKLGNDFNFIKISVGSEQYRDLQSRFPEAKADGDTITVSSPDGYKFLIAKGANTPIDITELSLFCKDLSRSHKFWADLLKMKSLDKNGTEEVLTYDQDKQASLRLKAVNEEIDHKTAFGRIAFSCPSEQLKGIEKLTTDAGHKVLTPYVSLDTPGKATVQVVIIADPDGHEICFVGDEGFRQLSQVDPKANELIEKSMAEDQSDEWFSKKNMTKKEG